MPRFEGSDFSIELPAGCRDESTYMLALPVKGGFQPSLVVKTQLLPGAVELSVYAADQRREMREVLPWLQVVREGKAEMGEAGAEEWEYEWGEVGRRVRQRQRFVLLREPQRVVTMTGTATPESFGELEELFGAAFASLRSRGGLSV